MECRLALASTFTVVAGFWAKPCSAAPSASSDSLTGVVNMRDDTRSIVVLGLRAINRTKYLDCGRGIFPTRGRPSGLRRGLPRFDARAETWPEGRRIHA